MREGEWRRRGIAFVAMSALWATLLGACASHDFRQVRQSVEGGEASRGRQAILTHGCGSCHVVPGVPHARGAVGPPLTSFSQRAFVAGQFPNHPDALIRWIQDPQGMIPETAMPNVGVSEEDARDIAAYLYTLR
jgi:cytochrome c